MQHRTAKFLILAAVLASAASWAADTEDMLRKRYEADRTACLSGQSHQAQSTCLREAENAYAEARRGRLADGAVDYERNRLLRCDALQGDARAACIARIRGQGTVRGSVEAGGVYRELVIVEPGTPPAAAPASAPAAVPAVKP